MRDVLAHQLCNNALLNVSCFDNMYEHISRLQSQFCHRDRHTWRAIAVAQTRIGDWKCGGLSSDYLMKQLRAADLDLQCYEASAAPPGWTCSWHRYGTPLHSHHHHHHHRHHRPLLTNAALELLLCV